MQLFLAFLFSLAPQIATPPQEKILHYVRPAKTGWVRESDITFTKQANGTQYRSVTQRGKLTLQVSITFDAKRFVTKAKVTRKDDGGNKDIHVSFKNNQAILSQAGKITQQLKLPSAPVLVTSAPDWSDIILLMGRYDLAKGGKQKFIGLWCHPDKKAHVREFTVEKLEAVTVVRGDTKIKLGKYRVHLRSGDYAVWAGKDRVVLKLVSASRPSAAGIILKGYEKAKWK